MPSSDRLALQGNTDRLFPIASQPLYCRAVDNLLATSVHLHLYVLSGLLLGMSSFGNYLAVSLCALVDLSS